MTQGSTKLISNYLSFCEIDQPEILWPPKSTSHENVILSRSWYISKSFYQIWVVKVSKFKYMNKYSESKNI